MPARRRKSRAVWDEVGMGGSSSGLPMWDPTLGVCVAGRQRRSRWPWEVGATGTVERGEVAGFPWSRGRKAGAEAARVLPPGLMVSGGM